MIYPRQANLVQHLKINSYNAYNVDDKRRKKKNCTNVSIDTEKTHDKIPMHNHDLKKKRTSLHL
jgi:hypothetical protein